MRIGILVNTLSGAARIHSQLKSLSDCEIFILLCSDPERSRWNNLSRHFARLVLRSNRVTSLRLIFNRKVTILHKPLDHPQTIKRLKRLDLDVGLHKTGIIYRRATIDCFRLGILNPHIGLLPDFRGRNVMEWALLQGRPVYISVFFIDAGIDTGERIVLSEEVDIGHCRSILEAKEYLFDLDASFFRRALELLRSGPCSYKLNDGSGKRYYVMSQLFHDVVEELIQATAQH